MGFFVAFLLENIGYIRAPIPLKSLNSCLPFGVPYIFGVVRQSRAYANHQLMLDFSQPAAAVAAM